MLVIFHQCLLNDLMHKKLEKLWEYRLDKEIELYKKNEVRNTQLEFNIPVILGKYSDVSDTYFNSIDFNIVFNEIPACSKSFIFIKI